MTNIFERSWQLGEAPEYWKKVNKYHPSLQKLQLTQSLERQQNSFISSGRQGYQEVNIDSPKVNHAQPTRLPSMVGQLPRDRRGCSNR